MQQLSDILLRLSGICLLAYFVCAFVSLHPIFRIRPNQMGRPYELLGRAATIDLFSVDRSRATTPKAWWMVLIMRGLIIAVPSLFVLAACLPPA